MNNLHLTTWCNTEFISQRFFCELHIDADIAALRFKLYALGIVIPLRLIIIECQIIEERISTGINRVICICTGISVQCLQICIVIITGC